MDFVTLEVRDHVGIVTVDRPPVNALNKQLYEEITDTFASVDQRNEVRVVVFRSEGEKAFIAGRDLKESPPPDQQSADERLLAARSSFWAIRDCRVPVIGAVDGPALGAGLAYASVCDMLVASEEATFALPEINVGTLGGAKHLSRLVPQMVVRYMHFTGAPLTARELKEYGAVIEVVPGAQLMDATLELAEQIAGKSPAAIMLAKESLNTIEYMDLKEGYKFEQSLSRELAYHEDSKEAARAFREKRKPNFGEM